MKTVSYRMVFSHQEKLNKRIFGCEEDSKRMEVEDLIMNGYMIYFISERIRSPVDLFFFFFLRPSRLSISISLAINISLSREPLFALKEIS